MPIPSALQAQLEELAFFTDRADRIDALIGLAGEYYNHSRHEVPRTEANRVPGCESEVFFTWEPLEDGTQRYLFAVDNPQGISAMALSKILEGLSGAPTDEVSSVSEEVVYEIFGRELSMGKTMGLTGMVRMMKNAATRSS